MKYMQWSESHEVNTLQYNEHTVQCNENSKVKWSTVQCNQYSAMQEGATKYNVVYVKILHHPQRSSVVQNAFKCLNITCQTSMRNITPIATVELFGAQSNQSNFNVQFIGLQLKCITSRLVQCRGGWEAVHWWIVRPPFKLWSADESAFTISYTSTRVHTSSIAIGNSTLVY